MYDVIIVGARCSGAPTAMLLARQGYKVLLLERAAFPSDTLSGHYIQQAGSGRLQHWGLLDRLVATGCPPVRQMTFDVGPFALTGRAPSAGDDLPDYCPRRSVIDPLLAEAAVEAGAELRTGFSVRELVGDGERITGIRGRAGGGATVTEHARIVIGADGRHSFVARSVQAPTYDARPARTCAYYSYWADVPLAGAELYPRANRFMVATPTHDGLTLVAATWLVAEFHAVRADVEGNFLAALDLAPGLAERVRNGRRVERFYGTADLPFFFRRPYGPGWALVGDAGYHKDPITAQGMSDAFRDADLLAAAVDAGLSGRQPLAEALAGYERARNEAARPIYEFTHQLAGLEPPPPSMQQLFGALRGNQVETNRFFGLLGGTVSLPEFFAPDNIARILGLPAAA